MTSDYMKKNLFLLIAIILTGIISLSLHAIIINYFSAPTLKINPHLNQISYYVINFGTVIGSMFIYASSKKYWNKIRLGYRVILFAILITALLEGLFRMPFMNILVATPWITEVAPQIIKASIGYIGYIMLSFMICIFVPLASKQTRREFLYNVASAILITIVFVFTKNIASYLLTPIAMTIEDPNTQIASLPYGMDILIPAYITFIEPVIAVFIVYCLIREHFSAYSTLIKGLMMGILIIILHAGVYSVLQIASSEGNILYRIFYYGQFLWEYIALGLLTVMSIDLFGKIYKNPSSK